MTVDQKQEKGLLLVFTGNGKGKTTAALGLAFRAIGHDLPVCMIQFIKGSWKYGEIETAKHFDHLMELHVMGRGFTWKSDDLGKDIQAIPGIDFRLVVRFWTNRSPPGSRGL